MFPQIFGKYVLESEIAAGGMARVYLATLRGAVGFEKRLVVKQIRTELASDEAFVTRFVEEAKTAVELSHPNIVPVYELGVEQGVYYIAMELCEGLTLSEVLVETGPLGPAEGAYVGAEICRALDYAHRRMNIVHRDVTPRNVLIDDEGAVRLIDFGIAAPVTRADDMTRTEIFGSPGHMPPEQLNGAELSPATDVFAVGALLIEAWTGHPPFRRATAKESEQALFELPAAIDREQPPLGPLSALIASSVALDARKRPAAAEHLARPLREFLKSEDLGDVARRLAARVRRARRRSRSSTPWLPGEGGTGQISLHGRPLTVATAAERESAASDGLPASRTFAAREEIEVWTRKLSSAPAPSLATPAVTPGSRRIAAEAAQRLQDGAQEPPGISPRKLGRAPRNDAAVGLLVVCSAAFVGAAFAFGQRASPMASRSSAVNSPARLSALPAPRRAVSSLPGVPNARLAPSASPVLASAGPSRKPQKNNDGWHPSRVASVDSSAPAELLGILKITADPRAVVEVSGSHFHQLGQTPILALKLQAGRYQIVFRSETMLTPINAQVMVVAGGNRSVHADFRQAEPTVSVR